MTVDLNFSVLVSNLKNSVRTSRSEVLVPRTKFNKQILLCLLRNGFISSFLLHTSGKFFLVELKVNNLFDLKNLRIVSSSSRRVVYDFKMISKFYKNTDFFLVSTKRGVLLSNEVFYYGLGGVVLFDNLKYK